jgi:hypothetical protein
LLYRQATLLTLCSKGTPQTALLSEPLFNLTVYNYNARDWGSCYMFCQKCGSELPGVAKYCAKCGNRVLTPSLPAGEGRYCVNCGKPYEAAFKFCNYCGQPVAQMQASSTTAQEPPRASQEYLQSADSPIRSIALSTITTAERANEETVHSATAVGNHTAEPATEPKDIEAPKGSATERRSPASRQPPFGTFTMWLVAVIALLGSATFDVFQGIGRDAFSAIAAVVLTGSVLVGAVCAEGMRRSWRTIISTETSTDNKLPRRRKRVLVKSAILAMLFLSAAAGVGYTIGQSGVEAARIGADIAEMQDLGERITKARSPVGNPEIGWYVQMYIHIEPDVTNLDSVLHRLATEYPDYAANFPDQDSQTKQFLANVDAGIQRMTFLKREIAVAKKIGIADENNQLAIWRTEMIPLLKQEDALDTTN